jgi:hypothetical protein
VNARTACTSCGLTHSPGQLFVTTGLDWKPIFDDTCELEPAWRAAHAQPMPPGSIAYHATDSLDAVLAAGLDPAQGSGGCQHVCLAATAEVAAATMELRRMFNAIPFNVEFTVLEVDVDGLDLFFEVGEARHHGDPIPSERLRVIEPPPAPVTTEWMNPAWRRQHSDCLALAGLPLSRRVLRTARDEADRRHGYEHSFEQYRAVAVQLAATKTEDRLKRGHAHADWRPPT